MVVCVFVCLVAITVYSQLTTQPLPHLPIHTYNVQTPVAVVEQFSLHREDHVRHVEHVLESLYSPSSLHSPGLVGNGWNMAWPLTVIISRSVVTRPLTPTAHDMQEVIDPRLVFYKYYRHSFLTDEYFVT